jgi:hypothetical protein
MQVFVCMWILIFNFLDFYQVFLVDALQEKIHI